MDIAIYYSPSEVNKIKYIFHCIKNHPFTPSAVKFLYNPRQDECTYHLGYGVEKKAGSTHFNIPRQNLILNLTPQQPKPFLYANAYHFHQHVLYSVEPYSNSESRDFITDYTYGFDWLEMLFFHLSRVEEYYPNPAALDPVGRLFTSSYFVVRQRISERPVVDDLIRCFWQSLGIEPAHSPAQVHLSHDLDFPLKFYKQQSIWRNLAGTVFRRTWSEFIANYQAYQKSRTNISEDPYYSYPFLFRSSSVYGSKTLFLLAGGHPPHERPYGFTDQRIKDIITLAVSRHYQLGLHPSTSAARDELTLAREKSHLEMVSLQPITTSRQHFLLFRFPDTLHILQNLGICEDRSLGFRDQVGFRCGTAFPYRLYDLAHDTISSVVENPLILMDSALWHQTNYQPDAFMSKMSSFIHTHLKTTMSVNFHNSFFDSTLPGHQTLKKAYLEVTETFEEQ